MKTKKTPVTFYIKIIVSLTLLTLIIRVLGINNITNILLKTDPIPLIYAAFFVIFQTLFKSLRWNNIIKIYKKKLTLSESNSITLISLAFGIVTPGRVGEFIKAKYLRDFIKLNYVSAFSTVLIDKAFDLITVVIVGLLGVTLLRFQIPFSEILVSILILILLILITQLLLFENSVKLILKIIPKMIVQKLKNFNFSRKIYLKALGYSFLIWSTYIIESIFIFKALNISNIPVSGIMVVVSLMALGSLIPISFGGIGVRELIASSFLLILGITPEISVTFAILYTIISFGFPSLVGGVLYIFTRKKQRNIAQE
tara:strand:+ start:7190 stop:8128 length:939 start_codon:yes stop_codon:yes gene_type:complete